MRLVVVGLQSTGSCLKSVLCVATQGSWRAAERAPRAGESGLSAISLSLPACQRRCRSLAAGQAVQETETHRCEVLMADTISLTRPTPKAPVLPDTPNREALQARGGSVFGCAVEPNRRQSKTTTRTVTFWLRRRRSSRLDSLPTTSQTTSTREFLGTLSSSPQDTSLTLLHPLRIFLDHAFHREQAGRPKGPTRPPLSSPATDTVVYCYRLPTSARSSLPSSSLLLVSSSSVDATPVSFHGILLLALGGGAKEPRGITR